LHDAEIDRVRARLQQGARGSRGRARQPQVAREHVSGPTGNDTQGDAGSGDAGCHLHRGAVAAVAHEDVESCAERLLGDAPRITRARDRAQIHAPAAAAEDL